MTDTSQLLSQTAVLIKGRLRCWTCCNNLWLSSCSHSSQSTLLPTQSTLLPTLLSYHTAKKNVVLQATHRSGARVSGLGASSTNRSKSMKSACRSKHSLQHERLTDCQKVLSCKQVARQLCLPCSIADYAPDRSIQPTNFTPIKAKLPKTPATGPQTVTDHLST